MSSTHGVIKTSNVQYLAFSLISPTCNFQVNYASFSSFLDSISSFITKPSPYSFHLLLFCTFLFHRTRTKSFKCKPISYWCTTFIIVYIQIHAKGWLCKLLPLLLNVWLLSPHACARLPVG